jgi:hypothetical protein
VKLCFARLPNDNLAPRPAARACALPAGVSAMALNISNDPNYSQMRARDK